MPTIRQKLVASKMLENTGKSVSQAMREVGYKDGYTKNPQELTSSKGWAELMNQYIPEKLLLQRLKQLLNKRVTYWVGEGENKKLVRTKEIDTTAVSKALDLACKIRGKYQIDTEEQSRNASLDAAMERISKLFPDAEL